MDQQTLARPERSFLQPPPAAQAFYSEVLQLMARGMSNQEIADALVVGEATVRSHVSAILRKLQLASRTQAALYALREGIASLEDTDPPR